ncbi:hypothetical protein [Humidesulfovibrio idahonensis]
MPIRDLPPLEAVRSVEAQLRELLLHPGMSTQDKASIILASTDLSEVTRRHMGKWTPMDPKTLPPRAPGQEYPTLPKGWVLDWENAQEVANA